MRNVEEGVDEDGGIGVEGKEGEERRGMFESMSFICSSRSLNVGLIDGVNESIC